MRRLGFARSRSFGDSEFGYGWRMLHGKIVPDIEVAPMPSEGSPIGVGTQATPGGLTGPVSWLPPGPQTTRRIATFGPVLRSLGTGGPFSAQSMPRF
jgi:hypothetical protein